MSGIKLSGKYGLNPSIEQCFVCGEDVGVLLHGKLKGDVEAPRKMVLNKEPCDKCQVYMGKGIIFISVDLEKTGEDMENPYRSGGWVVIKEEAVRMMMTEEIAEDILKRRIAFVPDDVWDEIGLPRGPVEGVPSGEADEVHH